MHGCKVVLAIEKRARSNNMEHASVPAIVGCLKQTPRAPEHKVRQQQENITVNVDGCCQGYNVSNVELAGDKDINSYTLAVIQ